MRQAKHIESTRWKNPGRVKASHPTELNYTREEVTNPVKLEGRMYQAATRVNASSPVMINAAEVDGLFHTGRQNFCVRNGKVTRILPGSQAAA